jgi:hypothetical protein
MDKPTLSTDQTMPATRITPTNESKSLTLRVSLARRPARLRLRAGWSGSPGILTGFRGCPATGENGAALFPQNATLMVLGRQQAPMKDSAKSGAPTWRSSEP